MSSAAAEDWRMGAEMIFFLLLPADHFMQQWISPNVIAIVDCLGTQVMVRTQTSHVDYWSDSCSIVNPVQ